MDAWGAGHVDEAVVPRLGRDRPDHRAVGQAVGAPPQHPPGVEVDDDGLADRRSRLVPEHPPEPGMPADDGRHRPVRGVNLEVGVEALRRQPHVVDGMPAERPRRHQIGCDRHRRRPAFDHVPGCLEERAVDRVRRHEVGGEPVLLAAPAEDAIAHAPGPRDHGVAAPGDVAHAPGHEQLDAHRPGARRSARRPPGPGRPRPSPCARRLDRSRPDGTRAAGPPVGLPRRLTSGADLGYASLALSTHECQRYCRAHARGNPAAAPPRQPAH